jgi:hypothetical protein
MPKGQGNAGGWPSQEILQEGDDLTRQLGAPVQEQAVRKEAQEDKQAAADKVPLVVVAVARADIRSV